jgi:two-component system, cell cycle response regulator
MTPLHTIGLLMLQTPFRPLAHKLTRAVLGWGLAGALLVGLLQGWQAQHQAEARLRGDLQRYVAVLATRVAVAVYEVNYGIVKDQLDIALLIPGVGYAAVVEAGSVVAESGDLALRDRPQPLQFPVAVAPERTGHRLAGRQFGVLKVVVDQAAIAREVAQAVVAAVLPCLLLTGVLLASALLVVRGQLQRPMAQIAAFLGHLDAGRLGERLQLARGPSRTHDEIDRVADAFGAMQQRLAAHVGELDARVAQRTEALQTALDALQTLSITDPLTGCDNRLAFTQKLPEALAHAERYGRPLSVVFCDVDRFKSINDNHGHPVGDRVLAAMGQCLRDSLRASSDWVARYGGEEFVLVLPETPLAQALDAAERLRQRIAQELRVELPGGQVLRVTASLGVAEHRAGESGESLLARADEQLYAAKQGGRNQVQPPVTLAA